MQREYFEQKGVKFEDILLDEKPEEIPKMVAISGQMGVPFTVIEKEDGRRVPILGFDRGRIDAELGLG